MKIALTQRLVENTTYPETRDALDLAWGRWFADMKWIPLPLMTGYSRVEEWLAATAPDGIMFTGGNDLSSFSEDPLSQMRDQFETRLLEVALQQKLPIIGICRGAQFLAHRFGSRLGRISGHVACRHALKYVDDHPLAKVLAPLETVNSYHQMGILQPGAELQPLAWAADGSLEAFIHRHHKVLSIMWHPERETPFQKEDQALIRAFLQQA